MKDKIMALADAYRNGNLHEYDSRAALLTEVGELVRDAENLRSALKGVMPWVVVQEFACHGMKCREALCQSCSFETEEAAERACAAAAVAYNALAAQGEPK